MLKPPSKEHKTKLQRPHFCKTWSLQFRAPNIEVFHISNKSCKSDVGQHCHRKVDESIYQTSQFGTLLREPWTLFGSTLSTLDLSWNSLCPLVAALLGKGPIWTHSGQKKGFPFRHHFKPKASKSHQKPERVGAWKRSRNEITSQALQKRPNVALTP